MSQRQRVFFLLLKSNDFFSQKLKVFIVFLLLTINHFCPASDPQLNFSSGRGLEADLRGRAGEANPFTRVSNRCAEV